MCKEGEKRKNDSYLVVGSVRGVKETAVIVSRAVPDVRDGLKPVHRRILYGMSELGSSLNRPYKKLARIFCDVLGKYQTHIIDVFRNVIDWHPKRSWGSSPYLF